MSLMKLDAAQKGHEPSDVLTLFQCDDHLIRGKGEGEGRDRTPRGADAIQDPLPGSCKDVQGRAGGRDGMVVITPRSIALRVEKFGACVLVFVAKS